MEGERAALGLGRDIEVAVRHSDIPVLITARAIPVLDVGSLSIDPPLAVETLTARASAT